MKPSVYCTLHDPPQIVIEMPTETGCERHYFTQELAELWITLLVRGLQEHAILRSQL